MFQPMQPESPLGEASTTGETDDTLRGLVDRIAAILQQDNENGVCRLFEIGDIVTGCEYEQGMLLCRAVELRGVCQKSHLYSCATVSRTFPAQSDIRHVVQTRYSERGVTFVKEAARLENAERALKMLEQAYVGGWSTRRMTQEVRQLLPSRTRTLAQPNSSSIAIHVTATSISLRENALIAHLPPGTAQTLLMDSNLFGGKSYTLQLTRLT
jgi:hypothetical protein